MKKLKLYIKRLLYTTIIFFILKMALNIASIPDYRGGRASVVYSEDGKYKGMIVYPKKDSWKSTALLVRTSDNEVLAIERLGRDGQVVRTSLWFNCISNEYYNKYNGSCFIPAHGMDIIELPPSLWHRVHAWLTVKIHRLENPNLIERDKTPEY